MPIFTGLLLIFVILAILPVALRNNNARESRRQKVWNERKMIIGAQICEAGAMDAFGIELDHSVESIAQLDLLITNGWAHDPTSMPPQVKDLSTLTFVFASYLGDVLVQHKNASWQLENEQAILYFRNLKRMAYPFELITQKLREPGEIDLVEETSNWLKPAIHQESNGITTS
jgi:hypothetical protein